MCRTTLKRGFTFTISHARFTDITRKEHVPPGRYFSRWGYNCCVLIQDSDVIDPLDRRQWVVPLRGAHIQATKEIKITLS